MKKEEAMDRTRFEQLLEAYGADSSRWPEAERAEAAAFAAAHGDELAHALAEARAMDTLLKPGPEDAPDVELLTRRILKSAPSQSARFDRRAAWALAACAIFGVLIGYGGGLLAPLADDDAGYFTAAFEAPSVSAGDEG